MSAFTELVKNLKGRNFGGTAHMQIAEPYLSGYHYTYWNIPNRTDIAKYSTIGNPEQDYIAPEDITEILSGTCLSVTPPGGTINKTEIQGIGNTKWNVPTGIDYGTELSCKFLEFQGLPVFRVISGWCKLIRDNKSGLAPLTDTEYIKSNYAGTVFYWTTKPDGQTVEYAAAYSGVFPTTDPQNLFNGDVASIDKLEMDISFSLDFIWHEDWVFNKCQEYANMYAHQRKNYTRDNEDTVNNRGEGGPYSEVNFH